ncbi:MAG: prolyl oligopeptidase family serine peptidase [Gemmatimonadales bacterium]
MSPLRLLPVLAIVFATPAAAQTAWSAAPELTIPWIMRGPETVGREPTGVRWAPDGQWLYFNWLEPGSAWREPTRVFRVRPRAGSVPERLTLAAADSIAPLMAEGVTSRDGRRRVVSVRNDLFLIELPSGAIRQLTDTPGAAEQSPSFDLTGNRVFFRRDANLFAFDLPNWRVTQLTNIRLGPRPDSAVTPPQRAFLAQEELRLLAAVRDRVWRDSLERAEREAREARMLTPVYLARGEQVDQLVPSPTGAHALLLTSTPGDVRRAGVPDYVAPTGFTEMLDTRIKVGDGQARRRLGLLTVATGRVEWIRPIATDSGSVYAYLAEAGWNDAGTAVLVMAISRDYTARHLLRIDADSGAPVRSLDLLRDTAWVGGPCGRCAGWLAGEAGVWFVSEADGFAHLYTVAPDGSRREQRTRGHWEVLSAELTPDRTRWALHTSEPSLYQRHFYLLPTAGGAAERLTSEVGGHSVSLSPDGRWMADVFSTANRPPELFVRPARGAGQPVQLTTSPTAEWLAYPWLKPDIIEITASDGVQVPARIYRPSDVGASPNGAAVIFVHGAGYLHNVHDYWSNYYREYQFHHLLARKGYVVLDIDYRASAGYGRDWRTAIYRHMGGRDLQDHVDGARYLNRELGISFDRIGIYGGSYGGFITLMALFTEARYFGAGAALRSVTDWAHYNHPYTAAILNEPQGDSVAFRRSSPIYFAEGLEDPLLIAHGMVDVNVHFQDVVRLSQRLIELGKVNWEMAVYPVEDHGFVRPDSWTDEYRRILDLFERWLHPR